MSQRFHAVQAGHMHPPESFSQDMPATLARDPHSVMTLGLFILTLVPLARVAFCFAAVPQGARLHLCRVDRLRFDRADGRRAARKNRLAGCH